MFARAVAFRCRLRESRFNRCAGDPGANPAADKADSVVTTRAILKNMGVAFPHGDIAKVKETLETNDYMGWRKCTAEEGMDAAREGKATICVTNQQITILPATDDQKLTKQDTPAIMRTIGNTLVGVEPEPVQYFAYLAGTTGEGGQHNNSNIHFESDRMEKTVGWSGYTLIPMDCSIMMVSFTSSKFRCHFGGTYSNEKTIVFYYNPIIGLASWLSFCWCDK